MSHPRPEPGAVAWAAMGLLTGAILGAPLVAGEPPQPGDLVETSQVDVVEAWPFAVRARKKGDDAHCRTLGPDALRVTEDGAEVRVLSVTQAPPLSTHVLLIDTSSSMTDPSRVVSRKRGRQAKAAARAYVEWMLESASAESAGHGSNTPELMLLTFDDDLIMHVPPSPIEDRRAAQGAMGSIRGITGGYETGLNDAVWRTVDHLATREGRSVVILLSDGIDNSSRRTSDHLVDLTQRTNNVTVFAIGIGLRGRALEPFVDFLERVARSTGGRYFGVWGKPADLAKKLDGRFEEIQRRLASQLYVSWLTGAGPREASSPGVSPTVDVRIESRDRRCAVPDDGYRPRRALAESPAESSKDPGPLPAPDGKERPDDSAGIQLILTDLVYDADPLIRYGSEQHRSLAAERPVRLDVPRFSPAPRTALPEPEATMHRWLVADRLPVGDSPGMLPTARDFNYPVAGEINGKSFLELRDELAQALWAASPEYRQWAEERAGRRIRARFERLLPPPEEPAARAEYQRRLAGAVRGRVAGMGAAAYRDDLAGWLGDVAARDLADRLERFEANLLLAGGAEALAQVDRAQARWVRLGDWLRFPDRVRVTVPLALSCRGDDGPCGYYRLVLPRLGDLPEDLSQPTGKTLEPTAFDQFLEYERIKVPRHPFGLMTVRWLLGLPAEPETGQAEDRAAPMAGLTAAWRIAAVRHWPEEFDGPAVDEATVCLRMVRLDLERDGRIVPLELLVEGRMTAGEDYALPDPCEALPGPVQLTPRCYRLGRTRTGNDTAGLAIDGVPRCTDR